MCAALKLDKASEWLDLQRAGSRSTGKSDDTELTKVVKDSTKVAEEQLKGMANQVVKNVLFNGARQVPVAGDVPAAAGKSAPAPAQA